MVDEVFQEKSPAAKDFILPKRNSKYSQKKKKKSLITKNSSNSTIPESLEQLAEAMVF